MSVILLKLNLNKSALTLYLTDEIHKIFEVRLLLNLN